MAFMQHETLLTDWLEIETSAGTYWLPADVPNGEDLADFVEGEINEVTRRTCWGARLSASGYMDCTEWCAGFDTEEEAEAYLVEMYGEEAEGEEACCSLCGEPVEGREKFSTDGETYTCQKCADVFSATLMAKALENLGRGLK